MLFEARCPLFYRPTGEPLSFPTFSYFLSVWLNNKHALLSNETFNITYIIPVLLGLAVLAATWTDEAICVMLQCGEDYLNVSAPKNISMCDDKVFEKRRGGQVFRGSFTLTKHWGMLFILWPDAQYEKVHTNAQGQIWIFIMSIFLKNCRSIHHVWPYRLCLILDERSKNTAYRKADGTNLIVLLTFSTWEGSNHTQKTAKLCVRTTGYVVCQKYTSWNMCA